jgi:hypothetical protein
MATEAVKAANVTKYDAGGSGDNVIPDGYIKAVEKIWMDSYTIAFVLTNTTISIATLPANKKITSIEVMIETSVSQTNGNLSLGFSTDADAAAFGSIVAPVSITHNQTISTLKFPGTYPIGNVTAVTGIPDKIAGFQKVTSGTQVTIALKLNNWTMTTGTVKSIVRYT